MTAHAVAEVSPAATERPLPRRRSSIDSGADYILGLQRSAGNDAVARHLAGQQFAAAGHRHPGIVEVQRCGPTPCNCSSEERADFAAKNPDEQSHGRGAEEAEAIPAPTAF